MREDYRSGQPLSRISQTIQRFLRAEEVPRWFGLSLVLIYLVGLGAVARLGIVLARRDAAAYFQQSSQYAVRQLANQLNAIEAGASAGSLRAGTDSSAEAVGGIALPEMRRAMREFMSVVSARAVRIIEDNRIVVSSQPNEADVVINSNEAVELAPGEFQVVTDSASDPKSSERRVRTALSWRPPPAAGSHQPGASPVARRYLEVILPMDVAPAASLADHAATLTIILVVLGALFLVYRCLREQMRSVWRIADRLELHRGNIEQELSSLRIADALDTVSHSWNGLVDLTERLLVSVRRSEANEELSRALQKQSGGAVAEALHAVPDGIIFLADEVRFDYVNAAALRLLGWNAADSKRWTLPDAQSSGVGEQIVLLLRNALRPDGTFEACTEVVESNPDQSSYRVFIIPLQRNKQTGRCVVVIRDVSQQLRAERAREEFVAQVTHELRTPLTNIRAYAETLSSGMFEDPKVITECYNVITKETRRLSRLIEDILSVSQLEVGSIELRLDQVDLRALLNEGLRDVRGLADEKNIDVQLVLPAKLEPVRGDRDKLAVVVNNLLGNAIKYTQANGNVIVGCQFTADTVVMTFKDNGIGIDPKDHARVFEKFQRGSEPEVQQETGTGIGLYTAREIVRRHGGDLELISERGKGSTFLVRLPRSESRAGALSAGEAGLNRATPGGEAGLSELRTSVRADSHAGESGINRDGVRPDSSRDGGGEDKDSLCRVVPKQNRDLEKPISDAAPSPGEAGLNRATPGGEVAVNAEVAGLSQEGNQNV